MPTSLSSALDEERALTAPATAMDAEATAMDTLLDGPDAVSTYAPVLQNSNFLALWLGQMASQLGDRVVFVVFIAAMTARYGANDGNNSLLYIAFTIPAITLTALAGVLVDRWPRSAVLVGTNVLRALAVALLPWAMQFHMPGILAIAALVSVATQFFVPAEAATIPAIVPKQHLLAANGLFTTTMMASVVFGFALGDPLVGWLGLDSVHWAIVALFVLASVLVAGVRLPQGQPMPAIKSINGTVWHTLWSDFQSGCRELACQPALLSSMVHLAVLFSCVVALCILLIPFARTFLYTDPVMAVRRFAYVVSFSGVGMALGSLWVPALAQKIRPTRLVSVGFLGMAALLGMMLFVDRVGNEPIGLQWVGPWLTARVLTAYGAALLLGVGAALVAIPLQTRIQHLMASAVRGKLMGIQFTLLSTSSTVPVLLAGYGVQWFGLPTVWLAMAALLALVGLETVLKPWALESNLPLEEDSPCR